MKSFEQLATTRPQPLERVEVQTTRTFTGALAGLNSSASVPARRYEPLKSEAHKALRDATLEELTANRAHFVQVSRSLGIAQRLDLINSASENRTFWLGVMAD